MGFSQRLQHVMDLRGFPKRGRGAALARETRSTPAAASLWLNKDVVPVSSSLDDLAKWLRCDRQWLESGDGPQPTAGVLVHHEASIQARQPDRIRAEVAYVLTQCLAERGIQMGDIPQELAVELLDLLWRLAERDGSVEKAVIVSVLKLMRLDR